jgi:hypothetical protein
LVMEVSLLIDVDKVGLRRNSYIRFWSCESRSAMREASAPGFGFLCAKMCMPFRLVHIFLTSTEKFCARVSETPQKTTEAGRLVRPHKADPRTSTFSRERTTLMSTHSSSATTGEATPHANRTAVS